MCACRNTFIFHLHFSHVSNQNKKFNHQNSISINNKMLFTTLLFCLHGVISGKNELHITNAMEFIYFSNDVNSGNSYSGATVILDNEIDFSGDGLSSQFEPIGNNNSNPFQGTFDGHGYTISGLAVRSSFQYVGLFGYIKGAAIRNVVLDSSCTVTSSYTGSGYSYAGGITGSCGGCMIESCVNMGSISFTGNMLNILYIGGIVGELCFSSKDATVKNCANYGSVIHSGISSSANIGGVVGHSDSSSTKSYV